MPARSACCAPQCCARRARRNKLQHARSTHAALRTSRTAVPVLCVSVSLLPRGERGGVGSHPGRAHPCAAGWRSAYGRQPALEQAIMPAITFWHYRRDKAGVAISQVSATQRASVLCVQCSSPEAAMTSVLFAAVRLNTRPRPALSEWLQTECRRTLPVGWHSPNAVALSTTNANLP